MTLSALILLSIFSLIFSGLRNNFYALHSVTILIICAVVDYMNGTYIDISKANITYAFIIHMVVINLTTYLAYAYDKHAAKMRKWRVPEKTLHAFMFIGGTLAAYFATKILRHKTRKKSFRIEFWLLFAMQLCVIVILIYL